MWKPMFKNIYKKLYLLVQRTSACCVLVSAYTVWIVMQHG